MSNLSDLCRHCHRVRPNRPRGLCWSCYYRPGVRAMYPISAVKRCCICGKEAVHDYQDRDDCPSCGSAACELQMQAALDYHEERGHQ